MVIDALAQALNGKGAVMTVTMAMWKIALIQLKLDLVLVQGREIDQDRGGYVY